MGMNRRVATFGVTLLATLVATSLTQLSARQGGANVAIDNDDIGGVVTSAKAFRYGTTTVAIMLGETAEKDALLAVEKLRKVLTEVHMPEQEESVPFSAGLAEAVIRPQYDPADIVTEVVNRAEQALDTAIAQGAGKVVAQAAALTTAAVA